MSENLAKRDPRHQFAAGLFLMIWSAIGWLSVINSPALWIDEYGTDPGPGLLPIISLTILSLGALTLITVGAFQAVAQQVATESGYWPRLLQGSLLPACFVISLIVYISLIDVIGFIPMSTIFSLAWMFILGSQNRDETPATLLPLVAMGTFIGVGLIYFVFLYLIGVPIG